MCNLICGAVRETLNGFGSVCIGGPIGAIDGVCDVIVEDDDDCDGNSEGAGDGVIALVMVIVSNATSRLRDELAANELVLRRTEVFFVTLEGADAIPNVRIGEDDTVIFGKNVNTLTVVDGMAEIELVVPAMGYNLDDCTSLRLVRTLAGSCETRVLSVKLVVAMSEP